jgi:hypothetical protein
MHEMLLLSLKKIMLFLPALAYAHGDDNVTVASFIGPTVAVIVFVAVVALGKTLLRMLIRRV